MRKDAYLPLLLAVEGTPKAPLVPQGWQYTRCPSPGGVQPHRHQPHPTLFHQMGKNGASI